MIHKRKLICKGCGDERPCIIETNQQMSGHYDELDYLKCILDPTNSSFEWHDIEASDKPSNCILGVVSGCTCPIESTDVYDDDGNYLGYVCLGCGYFSKY